MESCPIPIVIVSGSSTAGEVATNFKALEAGALAVVARPSGLGHSNHIRSARELIETVKLMAEVKVVRRWLRRKGDPVPARYIESPNGHVVTPTIIPPPLIAPVQIVAIGASTGGPLALQAILAQLPKALPVPLLIVQHMTPGFTLGFVEWLMRSTGFPIRVAAAGEALLPGQAYVAPDDFQMGVTADRRIALSEAARENGMRPSVSFLFRSVAAAFGASAVAVLLTGMGIDGAEELKQLKDAGAVTLVQDKESSIVHGMPGEAIKLGAATHILSPEAIAKALEHLTTPAS